LGKYYLKYPKRNLPLARHLRKTMTEAELKVWSRLRRKETGAKFRRQVAFGPYILDFLSIDTKLVIEIDGSQHYTKLGMEKDNKRDAFLRSHGLTVLRFSSSDAITNIDGVMQMIWDYVNRHGNDPL
jgi:adenine-specific DNA-methyltransferase